MRRAVHIDAVIASFEKRIPDLGHSAVEERIGFAHPVVNAQRPIDSVVRRVSLCGEEQLMFSKPYGIKATSCETSQIMLSNSSGISAAVTIDRNTTASRTIRPRLFRLLTGRAICLATRMNRATL